MQAGESDFGWARRSAVCLTLVAVIATLWLARPTQAFPYFARRYNVSCHTCHSTVPKLNQTGYAFRAHGYRFPGATTRKTIPFAGGFAVRYENRASDGVDDLYLAIVKAVTGGSVGDNFSYVVKWRPVSRALDSNGQVVDRSGIFDDIFLNVDIGDNIRLTGGQFRVFDQYDQALQLSATPPMALAMPLPGEGGETQRDRQVEAYSPMARTPAVMASYHHPGERDASNAADGLYANLSVPFAGEFAIPVNERAERFASFEFDPSPKGVVIESYYRRGASSLGGSAFLDDGRQMYTGLVTFERSKWGSSAAVSAQRFAGESRLLASWWGEYRPTYFTNVGLRLDDPGMGSLGAVAYGDYQWFSERAMVWLLLEQHFRNEGMRTIFQVKTVF